MIITNKPRSDGNITVAKPIVTNLNIGEVTGPLNALYVTFIASGGTL